MERWKMNKLGFINFWVYDEEVFPLKDGKILLRGSNGSGKSITTQSFIPYILDGDRQPSRLDPFGSKDRKMSFYLLDDRGNEKDESTGYLYLEFIKPQSNQYRTIGIGLHARKGGNMNTWGFCLMDGRRVGQDFSLYRTVGGKNIPYDARKLRDELGENNLFTEKMSEYKEIVAKNIFGISPENISDYDNLTDILIKTRSSKLASKENLKPAQLYEVLNESMKTLSDEELRPMADAMNRIEEIHTKIADAERARDESKHICSEYRKYNSYILWYKAKRYLKKHNIVTELLKNTEKLKNELEQDNEIFRINNEEYERTNTALADLKREKESLDFTDIDARVEQRQNAADKINKLKTEEDDKKDKLDKKNKQINQKYSEKKNLEEIIAEADYELETELKEYKSYEEYQFPIYENYLAQIKENSDFGNMGSACFRECQSLSASIKKALDSLEKYDSEKKREDEVLLKLDLSKKEVAKAETELSEAEKTFDEQKDSLIEKYHISAQENTEYTIDKSTLEELENAVSVYDGSSNEIYKILDIQKQIIIKKLITDEAQIKALCSEYKREYDEKCKELEKLKNMKDPVPERTERRKKSREKLSASGIKYYSYYECIDFKDDVDSEIRPVLEAALIDSGMLDALVIPEINKEEAERILGDISDCIIAGDKASDSRFFKSVFDFSVPYPVIDERGFYETGLIYGHSESYGSVRFVGAESRRRYREILISETENLIAEAERKYNEAKEQLENIKSRITRLEQEFKDMTEISDLSAACTLREKFNNALELKQKYSEQCEMEYDKIKSAVQVYRVESERYCSAFPYSRDTEIFLEAYNSSMDFMEEVQKIINTLKNISDKKRELCMLTDAISDYEGDAEDIELDIRDIKKRIHEYEETVRLCDEFLNSSENQNKKERSLNLVRLIKETEDKNRAAMSLRDKCEERIKHTSLQLETENISLKENETEENKLKEIFVEELHLGFTDIDLSLSPEKSAAKIEREISETEKQKSLSAIQDRLSDVYRKHSSVLAAEYGMSLEHCFEDDDSETVRRRMQITLIMYGKKLSPFEFEKELSETIENDKMMIRKNEENMFKDILLNTISKKLYCRIEESRQWVDSMSALMRSINTSMGLTFTLSWKPKNDIGEKEIGYEVLSRILIKSRELISEEDFEKLSEHFRSKIEFEKRSLEEKGLDINYNELVRNVLDFRNWFEFKLYFRQASSPKFSELTNSRFNTFSGGERALCLYIPLFAAVAAQYKKAGEQAPMILALDEAFAGVDDSNISEMFGLLEKLGFGYIMNSQALWGCYETVPALEIAELFHEKASGVITVILYEWNGKQKILEG